MQMALWLGVHRCISNRTLLSHHPQRSTSSPGTVNFPVPPLPSSFRVRVGKLLSTSRPKTIATPQRRTLSSRRFSEDEHRTQKPFASFHERKIPWLWVPSDVGTKNSIQDLVFSFLQKLPFARTCPRGFLTILLTTLSTGFRRNIPKGIDTVLGFDPWWSRVDFNTQSGTPQL